MRWERLWADLEAQADQLERQEFEAEVADRIRSEQSAIALMDRIRAALGGLVVCDLGDGARLRGRLVGYGADWLVVSRDESAAGAPDVLVPVPALRGVVGLPARAVPVQAVGLLGRRMDLRMVLRRLESAQVLVRVSRLGADDLRGTVVRVGADYLELRTEEGLSCLVPREAIGSISAA